MRKNTITIFLVMILVFLSTATGCTKTTKHLSLSTGESIQMFLLNSTPVSDEELDELERKISNDTYLGKCYNVTPQEYAGKDFRIFREDFNNATFLLYDKEAFGIGSGLGSTGVTSFAIADVDQDGNKELYYAYSHGSGMIRSVVGWFDFGTKESHEFKVQSFSDSLAVGIDSNNNVVVCTAFIGFCIFKPEIDSVSSLEKKVATVAYSSDEIVLDICDKEWQETNSTYPMRFLVQEETTGSAGK